MKTCSNEEFWTDDLVEKCLNYWDNRNFDLFNRPEFNLGLNWITQKDTENKEI